MADVVNLRTVRKAKARETATARSEANRAAFGRTKDERLLAESVAARLARTLDGARRD